jgi:hypothetical protein
MSPDNPLSLLKLIAALHLLLQTFMKAVNQIIEEK